MNYNKLISEDGKYVSKGSIWSWISLLVILLFTMLYSIEIITESQFNTISTLWIQLLLIFIGYKGVLKSIDKITIKKDNNNSSDSGE